MNRRPVWMLFGLASILACGLGGLGGCADPEAPNSLPVTVTALKSASSDTIFTAVVSYEGRTFDGEQTTFAYSLVATPETDQLLYKLYLELPECAPDPAVFDPPQATIVWHPGMESEAVRWTLNIEPGDLEPRWFSVTYDGEVAEGVVHAVVRSYSSSGTGQVYGPCSGSTVSGTVYVDTNEDGVWQSETEGGLADVLVQAVDAEGQWEAAVTDSNGAYRLMLVDGTYTVFVDTTAHEGYFNGDLGQWWSATTPLTWEVTVPPAVEDADFGFQPVIEDLVEDIIDDEIQSLGVPIKFWLNELAWAIDPLELPEGLDRRVLEFRAPVYTPEELLAFLAEVEGLALPEPFHFTAGQEFAEALAILTDEVGTPEVILLKELLTTELNFVADRGFVDDPELLEALILWGESLLVQSQDDVPSPLLAQDLRVAIELFQTINVGGGGGFDW